MAHGRISTRSDETKPPRPDFTHTRLHWIACARSCELSAAATDDWALRRMLLVLADGFRAQVNK